MKTKHLKNTISVLATFLKKEKSRLGLCINGKSIIARAKDTSVNCEIPDGVKGEPVSIDPAILKSLLATIKTADIELKTEVGFLRIITSEREYTLPSIDDVMATTIPADGEKVETYEINEADMQTIRYAGELYAVKDDIRPIMECIEVGEHIVATDSHKLLFRKSNIAFPVETYVEKPKSLYLHRAAMPLLKHATVGVLTNVKNNWLTACFDVFCLDALNMTICQVLPFYGTNKYPNWPAIIPYDNPNVYEVGKKELLTAMDSLSYIAKINSRMVVSLNGKAVVSANDVDYNLSHSTELTTYQKKEAVGDELTIGFNPKLLKNVLDSVDADTVTLACSMPNRPVLINEDILLMPIMLNY